MPAKVIVEMLGDGDGWDRMRHGSSEITHFSHIDTAVVVASFNSLDAQSLI